MKRLGVLASVVCLLLMSVIGTACAADQPNPAGAKVAVTASIIDAGRLDNGQELNLQVGLKGGNGFLEVNAIGADKSASEPSLGIKASDKLDSLGIGLGVKVGKNGAFAGASAGLALSTEKLTLTIPDITLGGPPSSTTIGMTDRTVSGYLRLSAGYAKGNWYVTGSKRFMCGQGELSNWGVGVGWFNTR